jgi:hypothetical protein
VLVRRAALTKGAGGRVPCVTRPRAPAGFECPAGAVRGRSWHAVGSRRRGRADYISRPRRLARDPRGSTNEPVPAAGASNVPVDDCRGSGTFSSYYGNTEDLVVALDAVLPSGEMLRTKVMAVVGDDDPRRDRGLDRGLAGMEPAAGDLPGDGRGPRRPPGPGVRPHLARLPAGRGAVRDRAHESRDGCGGGRGPGWRLGGGDAGMPPPGSVDLPSPRDRPPAGAMDQGRTGVGHRGPGPPSSMRWTRTGS